MLGRMALFGNKDEKAAKEAAGAAEVERLTTLSPERLAVELMPAFGPGGARAKSEEGTPPMQVIQWLVRDHPYHPSLKPLVDAVLAALEKLVGAGLLSRRDSGIGTGAQSFKLTPLGESTLADGSVAQRLSAG
jgi:hypothetical protein